MDNVQKFIEIEDIKNDVYRLMKDVNTKCETLFLLYKDYLEEAVKKKGYLMTLDVLLFQIELTRKDVNNYEMLFKSFLSMMYGQYYKLYVKMLSDSSLNNLIEENIKFPPYDDINTKEYPFKDIRKIHDIIINIIGKISEHVSRQTYTVEDDQEKIDKGLNINHLVYEKTHDIEIYKQKSKLFNNIITNYYEFQKKFLRRMLLKFKLLFFQIESDIQIQSVSNNSNRSSITNTIDKTLLQVKTDNRLESILINQLDISNSPKNKQEVCNNSSIFSIFHKYFLWILCTRI